MLTDKQKDLFHRACKIHTEELGRALTWYERARLLGLIKKGKRYAIQTESGVRFYRSGQALSREINSTTGRVIELTEVISEEQ